MVIGFLFLSLSVHRVSYIALSNPKGKLYEETAQSSSYVDELNRKRKGRKPTSD